MKITPANGKRGAAIAHAIRTTGTLLWCGTGVYTGDGRMALDPWKLYKVADETRKFIEVRCTRFTKSEMSSAVTRKIRQESRLKRLAHLAIDAGKYESARKLCDMAHAARHEVKEYEQGERVMFRINDSAPSKTRGCATPQGPPE